MMLLEFELQRREALDSSCSHRTWPRPGSEQARGGGRENKHPTFLLPSSVHTGASYWPQLAAGWQVTLSFTVCGQQSPGAQNQAGNGGEGVQRGTWKIICTDATFHNPTPSFLGFS